MHLPSSQSPPLPERLLGFPESWEGGTEKCFNDEIKQGEFCTPRLTINFVSFQVLGIHNI